SGKFLAPVENRYPARLQPESLVRQGNAAPRWIVVLGGGVVSDPRLPVSSQVSDPTLSRVVEGVRLYRAIPGSRLLLAGGSVFDPVPEADIMAKLAGLMGVRLQDISRERNSRNTEQQAAALAQIIGDKPFFLVTSAAHMPRAVNLLKKHGLKPIPAPTDYRVKQVRGPDPGKFFPGAGSLRQVETAWHEYLGLAWAWLWGLI
ncbi:MAG: ElyC/SanA/YdcF family protein, partial [Deltaproteobacteria bacterium]